MLRFDGVAEEDHCDVVCELCGLFVTWARPPEEMQQRGIEHLRTVYRGAPADPS